MTHNCFGAFGETVVVKHLQKDNYTILARNYKKFYGEVDIIASKGDILAFIEVKARIKPLFDPTQIIVTSKQQKIIAVAKEYVSHFNVIDKTIRFDVALIIQNNNEIALTYIENAFTQPD